LQKISNLICRDSANLFAENQQYNSDNTSEISSDTEREINTSKEKDLISLKGKYSDISSLGEDEFQQVAQDYQVSLAFVRSCYDSLVNYCEAHGKRYKNYLAALRNFVKSDALKIRKEASEHVSKRGIDARNIK